MAGDAAFKRHLIHTCTIQRASVAEDPYGNDIRSWSDHEQGVACRLVAKRDHIYSDALSQYVTVTTEMLLVAADTDLQAEDRITDLVLEDGSTVTTDDDAVSQVFQIESVLPRRSRSHHHTAVTLKRVS